MSEIDRRSADRIVNVIQHSLPAVERELDAFDETRTEHDRMRALKAIDMLMRIVKELRVRVEAMPIKPDVIDE